MKMQFLYVLKMRNLVQIVTFENLIGIIPFVHETLLTMTLARERSEVRTGVPIFL